MRIHTSWRKLAFGIGGMGLAAVAICWGRSSMLTSALADPPAAAKKSADAPATAAVPEASTEYQKRVVAYIFNTIPITREDLGEYLIARLGAERLQNLVNKRIIEQVCKEKGITVTAAEVEAGLQEDLAGLSVDRNQFVSQVLRKYNKTLYEWKEDVIKPRLLMSRLCRDRVQVTEEDIKMAFDAYYGEKFEVRIILWPQSEKKIALEAYARIRESEEAFDNAAKHQASSQLAASGGRISPIGRNTTGNPELEKAIFKLKEGELTEVIGTPDGYVVAKCVKRIEPDRTKKLSDERAKLEKEVFDRKIQMEIPKVFKEIQENAHAKLFLKEAATADELLRDVRQELQSEAGQPGPTPRGSK
jgi:hypothetical protein